MNRVIELGIGETIRREGEDLVLERGEVIGTSVKLKEKPPKALEGWDRLTCLVQVHHEHTNEPPTSTPSLAASIRLETMEQPYFRKLFVTGEWQKIDFAWLAGKTGMIVFHNRDRTEEVRIRLSHSGEADLWVPPFFGQPLCPVDGIVYLATNGGTAEVWVYAFPK